ncbi:MAG TPA: hypothetical protein VF035_08290 [Longimicrobiales bacterium]
MFLVPLALSALLSRRSLPSGTGCPLCAGDTIAIQIRPLHRLGRLRRHIPFERRWCLDCGWLGLVRVLPPARRPAGRPAVNAVQCDGGSAFDSGFTETLDVRTLAIDGRTWRVLLQCWSQTRPCYGRLVFVEPTGRVWADACEAFSGATRFEVIGQALSVPDGLLSSRLRRILSEA